MGGMLLRYSGDGVLGAARWCWILPPWECKYGDSTKGCTQGWRLKLTVGCWAASRPKHQGKSSSQPPHPRCLATGWARRRDSGAVAVTAPLGNIWLQAPESMGKR